MAASQSGGRRGLLWAVVGGAVLVAGVVAVILGALFAGGPEPTDTTRPSPPSSASPQPSSDADEFVDGSVSARGWIAEPITTDPDTYIRAALAAASTFDTRKSSRSEWLIYLDSWFTPDTRYDTEQDRQDDMNASQLELRQGVVLPEEIWDSLASEEGRVAAAVDGDLTFEDVPSDGSGDMRIGTGGVALTYTRSDGNGGETSYDEVVRVSVQVLCGEASIPTPNSAQAAGDCKVVRYFSGSLEP